MTTRIELAGIVHRRLRGLATDAGLSTAANGTLTEGDYTDAIGAALRAVGVASAAELTDGNLDQAIGATTREMLLQLELHYAALTDIKAGERDEKLSQIRAALTTINASGRAGASSGAQITVRKLTRRAADFEWSGDYADE